MKICYKTDYFWLIECLKIIIIRIKLLYGLMNHILMMICINNMRIHKKINKK